MSVEIARMSAWVENLEIPRVASWKPRPKAATVDSVAEEEGCRKRQGETLTIVSALLLFRSRVRATLDGVEA